MRVSYLQIPLTVIFVVTVVALTGVLLYVLRRRRSFRLHTSPPPPPPIRSGDQTPDIPTADFATKELLYFFFLKTHTRVDPSGAPNKNTGQSSPDEEVVDVFKLFEANGPSRVLCTIKEEDKEDIESKPDVDQTTKNACLQSDLQLAGKPTTAAVEEEDVAVTVDGADGNTKTEFSTPCDSPLFYTPAGSPSRDFNESDFVVSVHDNLRQ